MLRTIGPMAGRTRVALALGSGGARGYAHIGAIRAIEERGLEIVGVSGASMGALVGGVYAAGAMDPYTEWATGLSQMDVVRLLDLSVSAPGAIRAERILSKMREILGDAVIEELPIPFTAVATDLAAGRAVWFQRGPVHAAIRASIAIPGVITPVILNGRVLTDGGTLSPLPIAPTVGMPADLTIGVSLGGEEQGSAQSPENASSEARPIEEWKARFRRSANQMLDTDIVRSVVNRFSTSAANDEPPEEDTEDTGDVDADDALVPKFGRVAVMNRSLDIMQSALSRFQLAAYPPDILVEVPRTACRSLDFHKAADMIALGRSLTEDALDRAGIAASAPTGSGPEISADSSSDVPGSP